MENSIRKNKENSKITKFILFICVLIVVGTTMEFIFKPENDVLLITLRIFTFLISLFAAGAILAFSKPEVVKIIIWPLCIFAIFLVLL